ncbi:hypothetical protein K378_01425 [Streptomyces sp. Amel2xB2]|uniref:hypothetical protein n=1 Tax=Streptomyces sp. Amel2xB2 TaxID=1305829 RepID=UPI000DBA1A0C|nr:hypothetical protein [Streptomyces sp. Amel2xB2]RAJ70260.1 hypothetical protein K378_01425 [Streptomyces sp. Amel2xB2]
MGYACYEIYRNGEKIEAGYGVATACEEDGCTEQIDRGLAHLCGKDPGGDEHGCGGYYCGQHLYGDNQCTRCSAKADEANRWVHPETGEEFDLRDRFLPAGSRYDARGTVWQYAGFQREGAPTLEPIYTSGEGADGPYRSLAEGEWEDVGRIVYRQVHAETATA